MIERLAPDAPVRVGDRPQLVIGVLEQVRVHGADAHSPLGEMRGQLVDVVDGVPREVQRDGRSRAGQTVHLGGVVDALVHVAWPSWCRKDPESGTGIPVPP